MQGAVSGRYKEMFGLVCSAAAALSDIPLLFFLDGLLCFALLCFAVVGEGKLCSEMGEGVRKCTVGSLDSRLCL